MIRAYPRLPTPIATELLVDLSVVAAADPGQLRARSALEHPRQEFYATAARQTPDHLADVRGRIREVASGFGFPTTLRGRADSARARSFDQAASVELLESLDIAPVDAAEEGVWSFMSLVLLPDVAFWRWPNISERSDYERLLGRPRNVFRRLWWRAYCLGADASKALLEDESVAIMERPSLGGNPRVARAVAHHHLMAVHSNSDLQRTEILREAAKRMRRFTTILTLPTLSDLELDDLVGEVFRDVVVVLRHQLRAQSPRDASGLSKRVSET